jgi:hypothetical protein
MYRVLETAYSTTEGSGACSINQKKKYIHTYVRTYIHTYIHRYIHTYIDTYIHTYLHTHIHKHVRTTVAWIRALNWVIGAN